MATNETVNIWVKVQGNAEKALKGITGALTGSEKRVKKSTISWKALALAVGGMSILVKVNGWMRENVNLAQEQEKATARLISIAKNVTKATDEQILSMQKLADEQQKLTTFGDEVIETGQSQLLSFGATTEQVEELTGSFTDLLAANKGVDATSQDAIDTANMLGKALSGQAGALSRVGILMDERQTKLIQEGDAATRASTLVEILNANYGGLAETLAQTTAGQVAQMENEIGDLREELGDELLPALISVKQATLDFYNVVLDNKGAVVSAIRLISDTVSETVTGWDQMINGGSRADAVMGSIKQLENINKEISSLGVEIGKASDDLESYLSADGASDDAVIATMEKRIDSLINQQILAEGLLRDLDNSARGHDTEAEAIEASAKATDHNTISIKENTEAKKDNNIVSIETVEVQRINRDSLADALVEEREIHEQRFTMAVDFAQQTANQVTAIMSAVSNSRQQELENDTKRQKEDVKNSTMSAKQKAKALGKIDEDQAKKQHELRLKEWRQNLIMSIVNTALAISKTIAVMGGTPAAIPFVIAAGLTGAVSTGIIAANKPKMFNGGELTDPSGMKGDVIPFVGRAGETVVTPEEKKNSGGGGNTVSIGAPQIIIQGDATPSAIAEIREIFDNFPRAIEDAFRDKLVNADIINGALSI